VTNVLEMARYGGLWGGILAVVGILSLFINRGETATQRKAHSLFRILFVLSSINFALAFSRETNRSLQRVAPVANSLMVRWLIASIFFLPAWPLAETALMRNTRSPEKTKALTTDYALALIYSIAVAGALAIAIVGAG
jgi:hypothetical protein